MASFLSGVEMKEEGCECEEDERKGTVRNHKEGLTDFLSWNLESLQNDKGIQERMFKIASKYIESSFEGMKLCNHLELYHHLVLLIRVITPAPTF